MQIIAAKAGYGREACPLCGAYQQSVGCQLGPVSGRIQVALARRRSVMLLDYLSSQCPEVEARTTGQRKATR
jgi:hypothetical protein